MNHINIEKGDVVWNYAGTLFSMGINYMLLPFFLQFFDDSTLGVWYIFMSLSNMAALLIFGFSPSFARSIAYCWNGARELTRTDKSDRELGIGIDKHLFASLLKTCRIVYGIIGAAAALLLLSIGTIYIVHVTMDYENSALWSAWVVLILSISLNIYYGYYISLLSGIGYVAERNKAQVVAGVFRILLTGFLLFMGWDLLGACIAYLLYGLILRIISRNYFLKAINTTLGDISYIRIQKSECINIFHTIWPNTWRDGMVSVSDYLCTQAGTIISSLYLSLPETGIYSLSVQLITAIAKIARSFQIAYIPALQTAYITDNEKDLKEINSMCILVYCVVYIAGVLALYVIGIPLLRLIKPDLSIDRIILLFIAILQFMVVLRNCYASFLSTTNRVHYWRAFIISGLLSVFLSMVILSYWKIGVWGIILPAIIVELIYNFWHWPIVVSRELKLGFIETVFLGFRKVKLLFKKR